MLQCCIRITMKKKSCDIFNLFTIQFLFVDKKNFTLDIKINVTHCLCKSLFRKYMVTIFFFYRISHSNLTKLYIFK